MPTLRNVWVNPRARLIRDNGEIAVVEVTGMLCEWG
jgi:hypothetical protein